MLAETQALIALYERTITAFPKLGDSLQPIAAAHAAHADALLATIGRVEPTGSPSPPPRPVVSATPIPPDLDEALAAARKAEQQAHQQAWRQCLAAPSERVALLGVICAARATHLEVLP